MGQTVRITKTTWHREIRHRPTYALNGTPKQTKKYKTLTPKKRKKKLVKKRKK